SDKPGQRAARILAARIEDFKKDANAAWLNEADLPVVDQGKNGMKALTPIEEELLKQSKNKKAQRERQIKRFKVVGVVLLTLFIIAGLIAGWQWQVASIRARKINIDYQAAQAQLNVEKDPTTALRLVEKAWQLDKNEITTAAISKIYRENSFYKIIAQLEQEVKSVFFSRDGQTIIAEFESGNQRAWNWQDGELQEIKRFNGDIADNKYPKNTQFTLTSTPEGIGHLWEQEGNKFRNLDFIGHEGRICPGSYDISPDEKYVLTGSEDKTARLWDLQGNPLEVFRGHESAVTSVAISSDGRYILTAAGNTLRLWELKDKELKSFDGHGGEVDSAVFSSDGQHLLIGSTDGTVRLWDLQGNQVKEFNGQGAAAAGVAFSKEKYIAAGFKDGSVRLWDLAGKELWNIKRNGFEISAVAFSPDGQRILIGSYDKTAWLLDLNGKEIQVFKGHKNRVTAAVFSPDGKYILTGSYDKTARLWNSAGKEQKAFKGHNNFVTSVAFSPDGRYILTGSFDQTVRLWDKEANELMIFKGHGNIIHSVAFSPGGQYILTGSADKTACLWDCQGNQIQVFKGHEGAVRSVGFSPDGRSVLSGSVDGTVRLWKIYPLDEFLNSGVCERLSSEQLKKYGIAD
ncbi:MAG: hypothetical protein QG657_1217, partial [Acidobacteriota bacterium]|nr:hypothetical protein [Acidobacteriota bacterium]